MSGVEGLKARVASADVWLQDSARVHAAAGKLGFAQHNENARALLADLLERIAALEGERDGLAYELADLHDSLWIAYKGAPGRTWAEACEESQISIGYIMGIHEIALPREHHVPVDAPALVAAAQQAAPPPKLETNDPRIPYTYPPAHIAYRDGWNAALDAARVGGEESK